MENFFIVKMKGKRYKQVVRDIMTCAKEYKNGVYLEKDNRRVSANTMIGLLSLALTDGDCIRVTCCGDDETSAELLFEKLGDVLL